MSSAPSRRIWTGRRGRPGERVERPGSRPVCCCRCPCRGSAPATEVEERADEADGDDGRPGALGAVDLLGGSLGEIGPGGDGEGDLHGCQCHHEQFPGDGQFVPFSGAHFVFSDLPRLQVREEFVDRMVPQEAAPVWAWTGGGPASAKCSPSTEPGRGVELSALVLEPVDGLDGVGCDDGALAFSAPLGPLIPRRRGDNGSTLHVGDAGLEQWISTRFASGVCSRGTRRRPAVVRVNSVHPVGAHCSRVRRERSVTGSQSGKRRRIQSAKTGSTTSRRRS